MVDKEMVHRFMRLPVPDCFLLLFLFFHSITQRGVLVDVLVDQSGLGLSINFVIQSSGVLGWFLFDYQGEASGSPAPLVSCCGASCLGQFLLETIGVFSGWLANHFVNWFCHDDGFTCCVNGGPDR